MEEHGIIGEGLRYGEFVNGELATMGQGAIGTGEVEYDFQGEPGTAREGQQGVGQQVDTAAQTFQFIFGVCAEGEQDVTRIFSFVPLTETYDGEFLQESVIQVSDINGLVQFHAEIAIFFAPYEFTDVVKRFVRPYKVFAFDAVTIKFYIFRNKNWTPRTLVVSLFCVFV